MIAIKGIMIQGTSSDAGKSYIVTGLCRIFSNMGFKVSPFKSQNMSNNSYVTYDGLEIGRAQGVQAEAAKEIANVHMNPILLKPMQDSKSEVVLHGKVYRAYSGMEYGKKFTLQKGMEAVRESLLYIRNNYDMVVIEGAGSPAEVNLNDREIVNMRIACEAEVPVILVTDIDRGGSFASLVGTLELVFEHKHRIKGVIFNKFRGDIKLLEDGLKWFEDYTGIKVVGVIPYINNVFIETEDAQSKHLLYQVKKAGQLDIAIIKMERVSNNTDIEPFIHEDDINIRVINNVREFGNPHAIIIPGTKSTINDLETLVESKIIDKLIEYYKQGGIVIGICGGYQALGKSIIDNFGVDSQKGKTIQGIGLLPIYTTFSEVKKVRQIKGQVIEKYSEHKLTGYEIHLGESHYLDGAVPFIKLEDNSFDGCIMDDGRCIGTYLHNIFHNDEFRNSWLNMIRTKYGFKEKELIDTSIIKEESYEKLADIMNRNLDIDYIMSLININ